MEESKKISALGGPFGRPMWYLLDEQGNPYPTKDTLAASELLSNIEKRRVGSTEKEVAGYKIWVSTVFLVLEHLDWSLDLEHPRKALFESMFFINDGEIGSATRRYATRDEAIRGHKEIVETIEMAIEEMGKRTIVSGLLEKVMNKLAQDSKGRQ